MEPRRTASTSKSVAAPEDKDTPDHASTESSQLSKLLAESRSEADTLRRELAAVHKKAEADQRHLQALLAAASTKSAAESAQIQRAYKDRLVRAETALEDAEHRSRVVQRNWRLLDNYLGNVQHHASASRAAFSRVIEQNDLAFSPGDLPPHLRHERPASVPPPMTGSRHRPRESPPPHEAEAYSRSLPPLLAQRRGVRSPPHNDVGEDRWGGEAAEPPYKRHRGAASQSPEIAHISPQVRPLHMWPLLALKYS
ncbi:hypothetical protein FB45DRAFT_215356 [Roridomyces roridus]|uniref:Uncharacterized protein n=1 Tax=Roridomyces roridus TaxID=1738132 RepID=A0AAD7BD69_9AGAR|nr:hypothetical protein FB45DRAFT_215356 [Roridomyces roridus]